MNQITLRKFGVILIIVILAAGLAACNRSRQDDAVEPVVGDGAMPAAAMEIAAERGLTPDDINAALKTYMPSGKWDEYLMFASGGHSGNLIVVGLPSMRILKNIAVFTPEAWQGYGFGSVESEAILDAGNVNGVEIRMGDSHHPGAERDRRRLRRRLRFHQR